MADPDVLEAQAQQDCNTGHGDALLVGQARVEALLDRIRCKRCGVGVDECVDCAGSGIDPDATLTDLPAGRPTGALTAADLHELARYVDIDADMFEAGDHRSGEEPHEWFVEEAARLRALANRARAYLGDPAAT